MVGFFALKTYLSLHHQNHTFFQRDTAEHADLYGLDFSLAVLIQFNYIDETMRQRLKVHRARSVSK